MEGASPRGCSLSLNRRLGESQGAVLLRFPKTRRLRTHSHSAQISLTDKPSCYAWLVASSWKVSLRRSIRIWFFALALLLSFAGSSPAQNATGQSAKTYLPFLTITPSGPVIVKASSSQQFVANGAGTREGGVKWKLEGNQLPEQRLRNDLSGWPL
jgi:hypothetical protein